MNLIQFVKSTIIYQDTLSNIQYGFAYKLKDFAKINEIQTADKIYSNTFQFKNAFNNAPSVLIGINRYDNQYDQKYINFSLTKKTTQQQLQIDLKVFQGTILNGLFINYLAIDTNTYPNFYISDTKTQTVIMEKNNDFYNYTFYVQYMLPQVQGMSIKKVQAFLTGFQTQDQTQNTNFAQDRFSIYFEITAQSISGFSITVSQQVGSLLLQSVQYNFIEINENPYEKIQTDLLNYNKFENSTQYPCFMNPTTEGQYCDYFLNDNNKNRSLSQVFQLNHKIKQMNTGQVNLFAGYNAFSVLLNKVSFEYTNPRFQIGNYSIIENQSISINFYVWYYSIVNSVLSQGIAIFEKSCDSPSEILNKDQCISQSTPCSDGTYLNTNICSLCDSSCFTCSDASKCTLCQQGQYLFNNACQSKYEPYYYCEKQNNNSYKCINQCQDQNCLQCSSQQQNSCVACDQSFYLFKNACLAQKPPKSFCDSKNNCTSCTDTNCQDCSSVSSGVCTKCSTNTYLFNGICYQTQPNGTFCDQNKICQACSNKLCQSCQKDLISCINCQNGLYQLEQNCFQEKPDAANCNQLLCTSSGKCLQRDQQGLCLQCASSNYFYKNVCYDQQPKNTCCDSNNKCLDSTISNCQFCNSKSSSLNICIQCQPGLFLYNNECWKTQPNQTYCNAQLICTECPSSLQNCQYCDDPSKTTSCLKCMKSDDLLQNNVCQSITVSNISCHYSCDKCFGTGSKQCKSCSSTTRQFNEQDHTCNCLPGYSSVQDSEQCWNDDLQPNQQIQQLGDYSVQLYYIVSLPFLVMNFHPFCDAYIYTLQQLGNFGIVSSNVRLLLANFSIFNYLNINITQNNEVQKEEEATLFNVIKFNSHFTQQAADSLYLFFVLFLIIALFSLMVQVLAKKNQDILLSKYYNYIFWNLFIKYYRIFSSYFYMQIFGRILNKQLLQDQSAISILIFAFFIIITLSFMTFGYFIVIKKSQNMLIDKNDSYINNNLIANSNKFHKHFWLFLEMRKILVAILICTLDLKISLFLLVIISFIMSLLFVYFKPYNNHIIDLIYLIMNEVIGLIYQIVVLTYIYSDKIDQETFLKYKDTIQIINLIFISYSLLINIEMITRKFLSLRKNNNDNKDLTYNLDISLKELGRSSTFQNSHTLKISNLMITPRKTLKI